MIEVAHPLDLDCRTHIVGPIKAAFVPELDGKRVRQ